MIKRRIDPVAQASAPSAASDLGDIALAERDDAREVQRVGLVRRSCKDTVEQPFGIVQPARLLVLVGDAQHLSRVGSGTVAAIDARGAGVGFSISPPCSRDA